MDKDIIANKLTNIGVTFAGEVEDYLIRSAIAMVYKEAYKDVIRIIKQLQVITPTNQGGDATLQAFIFQLSHLSHYVLQVVAAQVITCLQSLHALGRPLAEHLFFFVLSHNIFSMF